ncbi:acyltransferase [Dokdonella sp.]|uniref:acyltransferase n=1 Tax=Dokdonella sp. TaxID=2291710 RepID=UPI0025BBA543|nr:acyltransferase [Dokdonella sp.]MBX3688266.1 acyltransferase [Dokdonella sp.]
MPVLRLILIVLMIPLSTVSHITPLLLLTLVKALLPLPGVRRICNGLLTGIAESWIGVNNWMWDHLTSTRLSIVGLADADLRRDGHYLVLANHQSWVDILTLQKAFNRRIPLLRFFLKRQLFWVPLLGLAWWALDFPFMGRYTPKQIARNPELAGRDIEATRRACEKFREIPISIMNFVEGTRFTPAKHDAQHSPYRRLLKPKSGGVAFVLDAMGPGLQAVLDITIAYPDGVPSLADLLQGRVTEVRLQVRRHPLPAHLQGGSYQNDREFRVRFQKWMNGLWEQKDADLAGLLGGDTQETAKPS